MKRTQQRRSDCPISFALETFGDTWSLLIVRDIVYFGKKTYGDFLDSDERIATNILANRLAQLEERGILVKQPHETDKRKEIYRLTEKGLGLIPIMVEMANWSAQYDPETGAPQWWIDTVNADREDMIRRIKDTVRRGGAVFVGEDSVISQLTSENG